MMESILAWVQASSVAVAISQSLTLNATLSSVHLVGIALLVGGALISSLRLMGVVLVAWPSDEVTCTVRRGMAVGLVLTITTGALLVSPRVVHAAANAFFQTKMLLLAAAVVCHVTAYHRASVMTLQGRRSALVGAVGLLLWLGVVLAGAAFILLE